MFASKARILSYRGVPEKCSTWTGSGLTFKHWTRLDILALAYLASCLVTKKKRFMALTPGVPDSMMEDAWKLEIHCKYQGILTEGEGSVQLTSLY